MSAMVRLPGLQSTLQGKPRTGYRHMGMPWSGPADPLSAALANRLVGNRADATVLEVAFGGIELAFRSPAWIGVTGALASLSLNGAPVARHESLAVTRHDRLKIGPATQGARVYLAVAGGWHGETVLGSTSTYLPAGLGGYKGRALKAGDQLDYGPQPHALEPLETPDPLRPYMSPSTVLRACPSAEFEQLTPQAQHDLFGQMFTVGAQIDRMGLPLSGQRLEIASDGKMKSAAVFPGTVQCPASGDPIIMLADAQTTGGYPRIAHIARCDQHRLGQVRPLGKIRLLKRTPDEALEDDRRKLDLFRVWLPDFRF